ncbi:hypothetical protein NUG22_36930 [Saccharothrix longispora]|nr:hypothetical protein [Saccharothrix longispora]MDU0294824.1 hypothetical protein [Saccharothrix longispora]
MPTTVWTRVEKRCERGDLVGFRVHGDLGQDDAGVGVQRGEQVDLVAVDVGAAQGFAVHGDDMTMSAWTHRR